ncbi:hypothetical protein RJ640_016984 [Escallonia rubra]|uniref:U-box domain-containing protein n=1 Tax=Escallonia rubra TaxID=112253 RepID=A0AA88U2D1_9ASTE|nr:hypothetical protein RJ640_016984 [Escallonia rubra]
MASSIVNGDETLKLINTISKSGLSFHGCSFTASLPPEASPGYITENLSDSVVDIRLDELASKTSKSAKSSSTEADFLDLSQAFSDFSAYSSDISGELQRLASVPNVLENVNDPNPSSSPGPEPEPCLGFLQRDSFSTEIIESISPGNLLPTVKICIDGLQSPSVAIKRSAAAKLRLLAKNRSDNRALIGESGAIPALTPLLRCSDPLTQEHVVTALLNLSLHEVNKPLIANARAIKSLIYVLKTGTETSKQNDACALLSLALIDENKASIGACGAIPPLVALMISGSVRGKKDALTTLYKLCSARVNKEMVVTAGAVRPLVAMVAERGTGLAEKAMVVLEPKLVHVHGAEALALIGLEPGGSDGMYRGVARQIQIGR